MHDGIWMMLKKRPVQRALRICCRGAIVRSSAVTLAIVLPLVSWGKPLLCGPQPISLRALSKLALLGNVCAEFELGARYALGRGVQQDYKQAFPWFLKSAAQGNVAAEFNIGLAYARGQGVSQDYKEAVTWWRKGAEQGDVNAETALGGAYQAGGGIPEDYSQSAFWFRKAAEQGNTLAEFGLGLNYAMGWGVPRNDVLACMLIDLAAAGGNPQAPKVYRLLIRRMSFPQISSARWLADHWKVGTPLPTKPSDLRSCTACRQGHCPF